MAFLSAHKLWGRPIPGGPDAYVREWAQAGTLMGVESPPLSEADMRRQLDRWYDGGELSSGDKVAETVAFIRDPPLHPVLRPATECCSRRRWPALSPNTGKCWGCRQHGWDHFHCR